MNRARMVWHTARYEEGELIRYLLVAKTSAVCPKRDIEQVNSYTATLKEVVAILSSTTVFVLRHWMAISCDLNDEGRGSSSAAVRDVVEAKE